MHVLVARCLLAELPFGLGRPESRGGGVGKEHELPGSHIERTAGMDTSSPFPDPFDTYP